MGKSGIAGDPVGTGTIYLTIATLVWVLASYVINIFLGRILGPEKFGVYGVVIALIFTIV